MIKKLSFVVLFILATVASTIADESRKALIQELKKAGRPGVEHQILRRLEGKWKVRGLIRISPESNPEMISGTAKLNWIHGRRFLIQEFDCPQLDFPYSGTGILGYDTLLNEFTGAWCDTSNTGLATWKGTFDQEQNRLVFKVQQTDLQTAKRQNATATYTFNSDATIDYKVTTTDSEGVEFSPIELQYRKQKGF